MNRVMTAGLDRRWRRLTAGRSSCRATACSTPAAGPATSRSGACARAAPSPVSTSRRGCSSARAARRPAVEWVRGRPARAAVRRTARSTRRRSASASATSPTSSAGSPSCAACSRPGGRLAILEITQPRGMLAPFYRALVRPASCRCSGRCCPAARRTRTCPRACAASRARRSWRRCSGARVRRRPYRLLAGGIVALHVGSAAVSRSRRSARRRGSTAYLERARGAARATVEAHPGLVAAVGGDALAAGGKRLRPLLVFLGAPPGDEPPVAAGVAVELVHMATLVHDDVIDGAELRRGRPRRGRATGRRRARRRRLPLRARVRRAGRDRRRRGGVDPRGRGALRWPAARRCSARSCTTRTRRSTRISSGAR